MTNYVDIAIREGLISPEFRDNVLKNFPQLRKNVEFSMQKICEIREISPTKLGELSQVEHAVLAGSAARLEANANSDLDIIFLGSEDVSEKDLQKCLEALQAGSQLEAPNPKGSFTRCYSIQSLIEKAGKRDESYNELAVRLLLLLESVWIYSRNSPQSGTAPLDMVRERLLDFYLDEINIYPYKDFVFLINDLIRYFRSICVNYQFTRKNEPSKWALRNAKLRHSRVIMYFSMLTTIGVVTSIYAESERIDMMRKYVKMVPLCRLYHVYQDLKDCNFRSAAIYYENFLKIMSDSARRKKLLEVKYDERYDLTEFVSLRASSEGLCNELAELILRNRRKFRQDYLAHVLL